MSGLKHTPGPWKAEPVMQDLDLDICLDYQIPDAGNPIVIGFAYDPDDDAGPGRIDLSQARANARLMAAAPDLLHELICSHDRSILLLHHHCTEACPIRAAINKATGTS